MYTLHFFGVQSNANYLFLTTTHTQAIDADEREKWVRRLEDTILRHASRIRGISDTYCSIYGANNESTKRPDYLHTLDKRVSEADAYLQLMIEQTTKIEQKIAAQQASVNNSGSTSSSSTVAAVAPGSGSNSNIHSNNNGNSSGSGNNSVAAPGPSSATTTGSKPDGHAAETNRRIQDNANAMLDSIKHSIVLLQIAKNTAHPINGIYHGPGPGLHMKSSGGLDSLGGDDMLLLPPGIPGAQTGIMYGAECLEKGGAAGGGGANGVGVQLFVPETSYSSSEGEDDFFDANDDPYSSQDKAATL